MEDGRWKKPITIVDDGTETNDTRLGAVCDLLYAMDKLHIDDAMHAWPMSAGRFDIGSLDTYEEAKRKFG